LNNSFARPSQAGILVCLLCESLFNSLLDTDSHDKF
jgi:hypothetical protein